MANETKCLTSGAVFHTDIRERSVSVKADLPFKLNVDEEEAKVTGACLTELFFVVF